MEQQEVNSAVGQPVQGFFLSPVDNIGAGPELAKQLASQHGGTSPGGSGHYQIDREHIPEMIAKLKDAKDQVSHARVKVSHNNRMRAPGTDPYSPKAIKKMGSDLVRQHTHACKAYEDRLQAMIDSLNDAMRQYDANEDSAAQNLQQRT